MNCICNAQWRKHNKHNFQLPLFSPNRNRHCSSPGHSIRISQKKMYSMNCICNPQCRYTTFSPKEKGIFCFTRTFQPYKPTIHIPRIAYSISKSNFAHHCSEPHNPWKLIKSYQISNQYNYKSVIFSKPTHFDQNRRTPFSDHYYHPSQ